MQGLDAVMGSPLRGYMSKLVLVSDQGTVCSILCVALLFLISAGALYAVVGSLESFVTILSVGYPYILPKLEKHHLTPGTAFIILSALGLVPIFFIRFVI